MPELWPELEPVLVGYHQLGRDANGATLHTERESWLRANRIRDRGERTAFHRLWLAADSESARVRNEQLRAARERSR